MYPKAKTTDLSIFISVSGVCPNRDAPRSHIDSLTERHDISIGIANFASGLHIGFIWCKQSTSTRRELRINDTFPSEGLFEYPMDGRPYVQRTWRWYLDLPSFRFAIRHPSYQTQTKTQISLCFRPTSYNWNIATPKVIKTCFVMWQLLPTNDIY